MGLFKFFFFNAVPFNYCRVCQALHRAGKLPCLPKRLFSSKYCWSLQFVVIRDCHVWACGQVGMGVAGVGRGTGQPGTQGRHGEMTLLAKKVHLGTVRASKGCLCEATLLPEPGLLGPPLCLCQPRSLLLQPRQGSGPGHPLSRRAGVVPGVLLPPSLVLPTSQWVACGTLAPRDVSA